MSRWQETHQCRTCDKDVNLSEQVTFMDLYWHRNCFRCEGCGRRLECDMANLLNGSVYCETCHNRIQGRSNPGQQGGRGQHNLKLCSACDKDVNPGEPKVSLMDLQWHKNCFCCKDCGILLVSRTARLLNGHVYCEMCYNKYQRMSSTSDHRP